MKTPVVLTVFNRPGLTARVMEVLQRVRPERLMVIADGPRKDSPTDDTLCRETRRIAEGVSWPCELTTYYADKNLGCRKRMSSGLDRAFETFEEAIILEDDCVPDESFFSFCEHMLERYRDNPRIGIVSGTNSQCFSHPTQDSYYFSRYPLIWGWAAWRRTWAHYDLNLAAWPQLRDSDWLESIVGPSHRVQYWRHLFDSVHSGFDTWDYSLVVACWLHKQLAIHPCVNLVSNIGFGETATHTKDVDSPRANLPLATMEFPLLHPETIAANLAADAHIEQHLFSGTLRQRFAAVWEQLRHSSKT
jgi:hypothetical protein